MPARQIRERIRALEDWWFDRSRHVRTSSHATHIDPAGLVGEVRDSLPYIPVRVGSTRAALKALPIADPSRYTLIDVGSGEGRVLFLAAEHPFRRVLGVEFVPALHATAEANLRTFNHRKRRCRDLQVVNADAATFVFPSGHLVVYLFNPFGPHVLRAVLSHLEEALAAESRHIIVLMQWPVLGHLVGETPGFRSELISSRFHIYEAGERPHVAG